MLGKFRNVVLTALLLAPLTVQAAPVGAAIAAWYAAASWVAVAAVAAQVFAVAYSVYGAAQQRKASKAAARRARDEYNAGLQDRTITNVATDNPHRIIYGEARVGSNIVAMFSSGGKDEYKHLVCVHAAHECESIGDIYIAGKNIGPLDGSGYVTTGTFVTTSTQMIDDIHIGLDKYPPGSPFTLVQTPIGAVTAFNAEGYQIGISVVGNVATLSSAPAWVNINYTYQVVTPQVRVRKHLGTPTDAADAALLAELPSKWPSTATLRGFCYTVVRLDLNQPEFQSGIPSIEVVIKGKKLYDPRDGITRWSDNPALATYDYLTSDICGVPSNDLPVAQYITAANACDEVIGVGKRYTINGTVTSDQSQSQVLEAMAQCMAGSIVSTTWDIYAGKYVAPVMALNQTDIVGNIAITPGISDADLYNGVKGQYIGAENLWVSTDYKPYQNPTYAAVDGRDLWNSVDMSFTNTVQRVHNLCRIFVEDQRNGFTIKADFSLKAWGLKVGQRVTFTSEFFGQTAKVYRITDKKFSPTSAIELTLKEDAASIWDESDTVLIDDTPNTGLPNPWAIAPISSLTCTSGTDVLLLQSDGTVVSRILAEWPIAPTQSVQDSGIVEIQYQALGNTEWASMQFSGSNVQGYLLGVVDGSYYNVRIRAVNPTLNVKSDWTYSAVHKVIGKTAPPPNVTRFKIIEQPNGIRQFFWGMDNPPTDLFAYEVRYSLGSLERPWDDMVTMFAKDRNAVQHETTEPIGDDTYTFAIRAVDTTGNLSVNPMYVTEVMDGDAFGSVLKIVLPYQEYWPGTRSACYISGSSLINLGTLVWNTLNVGWGTTTETWGNTSVSPIVYEHTVVDLGAILTTTIRANALVSGTAVIEMATSNDNITYSTFGPIPSGAATYRYYKFRWTITGSNPIIYRAQVVFYT